MRFSKRKLHFLFLSFLCWRNRNRKKKKKKKNGKGQKHPIKIGFLRWSCKNVKIKKNGFFAKIAWHYLCQEGRKNAHFRAHYLFWPKNVFGPKTVQTRKNYKNSGFSGNCPKPKMTPFFGKRCFLTWVKKWVLLTVFLKSCVLRKHYFYSVFRKHSFSETKYVCWTKQKIYEK